MRPHLALGGGAHDIRRQLLCPQEVVTSAAKTSVTPRDLSDMYTAKPKASLASAVCKMTTKHHAHDTKGGKRWSNRAKHPPGTG